MVERFWPKPDMDVAPDGPFVRHSDYEALAREKEELRKERDEARVNIRAARRLISATHKNAVKHDNCQVSNCPICEGGLFVCADCGAAEVETEERICTAPVTRAETAERQLAERDAALQKIRDDCQSPIDLYNRNGPSFTSPGGDQYEPTSYVIDKLQELIDIIDAALAGSGEPKGQFVPKEILDRFPEINISNYTHDDVDRLNAWGVELVLAAFPSLAVEKKNG